ncbi:type II toxin-antitoxin system prevent-host-death family antitoxin [Streptomyces sp. NPDC091377]|uniref:type II toxin-antitoxin system prevent-host-death family antitoxin n=1 Tax=Streptomyces sp. NPDC091377 TaxID=3365995 RepID=UPI003823FEBF
MESNPGQQPAYEYDTTVTVETLRGGWREVVLTARQGRRQLVTRYQKPVAVLLPAADYAAMIATGEHPTAQAYPARQARAEISGILDRAEISQEHTLVTSHTTPVLAVVPVAWYEQTAARPS